MKPIVAPINPGDQGAEVANLQAALALLLTRQVIQLDEGRRTELLKALEREARERVYRDATQKTVSIFQEQHALGAGGAVDRDTASALNAALKRIGALDGEAPSASTRTVAGQVVAADKVSPFACTVILFQELEAAQQGSIRLGEDSTDPEGRYTIRYVLPPGIDAAALRVAAFDTEGQRRAQTTLRSANAMEVVNLVVQAEGGVFHVAGMVASSTRAGLGGLQLLIVDKNVGGDQRLAETTSSPDGSYSVAFTYGGPKRKPDLQTRAFSGSTLLGTSEVRYDASNLVTLNVPIHDTADAFLPGEHESLTRDLAAHFTGNLRDLQEAGEREDLTYLANKTGWDARAVALASLADEFSARTADAAGNPQIHPALFYALFRAGMPANDAALYRGDAASVEAVWKLAIAQGIAPAHLQESLPTALDTFGLLSARQMLSGPALSGRSSLSEMLSLSLPGTHAGQHEQFARLQVEHQGDPEAFWRAVESDFGGEAAQRLQLDGKLGYLTLNNAPLIGKLHAAAGQTPLSAPVDLIAHGFHRADAWQALIGDDVLPPEVAGADEPARRANYAQLLATQLRLSYPTAALAAMVQSGETKIGAGMQDKLHGFLIEHHEQFEICMQPIEQFVKRRQIQIEPEVQHEITRIQRVRQITPSDEAMNALLAHGLDSAVAVVRYERAEFIDAFKEDVGGEANAALIHAKAQQVHNAVLNIATSYLLASDAPGIGVHSPAQIVAPAPDVPANAGDVIAYPTLEKLFGEMDYCTCDHCRSVLSPAAYLVDLLQFLDRDDPRWAKYRSQWLKDHGNAPYPFGSKDAWLAAGQPAGIDLTPLQVLLARRPDLEHLPLTCENTNTALPYIDLVNETLEYFVANALDLKDYSGHSTDDSNSTEELLANPQFVQDSAYEILAGTNPAALLPPTPPLPFHQPLEQLRLYFDALAAPLPRLMEVLRKDDLLDRSDADNYGWRDIWMEELRLSRAEAARLSERSISLQQLCGFPTATPDADVLTALSNAKAFSRRLDITYEDVIALLRTQFCNPHGVLIPKLERLGMPLTTLKAFKDGALSDQQFDDVLAPGLEAAQFGGDIKAWVKKQSNYENIISLLVLTDPTGVQNPGSFDALEFRYADPAKVATQVRPFEFIRLLRFIRLWKKLGWSIEQTDKAITALYPADQLPNDADDNVNLERLDTGFLVLLPRLGVLKRVMDTLHLKLKSDLLPLLACCAPLDTYGAQSLYRKLFQSPALLKQDSAFADDGYGNVLDGSGKLLAHQEALRAALSLTGDEFKRIGEALGIDANTPLALDTVSAVFRRAWLARKLKLSVQEFLLLAQYTGLDPFAPIDPAKPALLRLIALVDGLRAAGLKSGQALYLIWNQDISGTSAPDAAQINEFARNLRTAFAAVENDFAVADDLDGQIARARMALVYDSATTDLFFGLLNNTLVSDLPYSHSQSALEQATLDAAAGRLAYDDFRKRLSFSGAMTTTMRDALKVGASLAFENAVDKLYAENQTLVAPFFARYPDLRLLYDAYVASKDPVEQKRSTLLADFLPALKARRKNQLASQALGAAAKTDTVFVDAILGDAAVLHGAAGPAPAALDDFTAIERMGLAAQFFLGDSVAAPIGPVSDAEPALAYGTSATGKLPVNAGQPVSGIWRGYLEVPEGGFYNIRIKAEAGASVALVLGDGAVALAQAGDLWSNATALPLRAGTLYAFTLTVEKVKDAVNVQWQSTGRGWEVIPARYLYSATLREHFLRTYVRFFKSVSLASAFKLTPGELAHLAAHADYRIGGHGWLNKLPVAGDPDGATSLALFTSLGALLDFARLKVALSPDDERLLAACKPDVPPALLAALTRWEPGALAKVLARFGKLPADLAHVNTLCRVADAFDWATTLGIPAAALITAAHNEPVAATVRDLQAALRARYAEPDWLALIKPINDQLRTLRRDALVAYILHQMRANPASAHIDTADKLFEYFLMDVQMAPCMQTSRIRHALSSIQLFIERCLMNLEPRVASAALNAKHWSWMKRYRFWEANRKVFLWPENWLEPELRDDQSPFFREALSELLQGDVTDDRAAATLLTYLSKLDEIAKLEPCGIHYVENNPGTADDVAHVVARTAGANRKYYYRQRKGGSWTPWDQIKLDIEEDPVIPVVWNNRLFVFWLRIWKQAQGEIKKPIDIPKDVDITAVKVSQVNVAPSRITAQAMLCWSEFYNGKWQPTKTSDVSKPMSLGNYVSAGKGELDRSQLTLEAAKDGDALVLTIKGQYQGYVSFATINFILQRRRFVLHNTHSLPSIYQAAMPKLLPFNVSSSGDQLGASYFQQSGGKPLERTILKARQPLAGRTVAPHQYDLDNAWTPPFFYEDRRHVFYVTATSRQVPLFHFQGYVNVTPKGALQSLVIPPLVVQPAFKIPDLMGPVIAESAQRTHGPIERFVSEDAYIRKALGSTDSVRFGDKNIGPAGALIIAH
jgi:hypothetical protein